jgi:hypothetical protein
MKKQAKLQKISTGKVSVCSHEKSFFAKDGTVFKSLAELAMGLNRMHEDTYRFHANDKKNDFVSWVRDVFGENRLASRALQAEDKHELAKVVYGKLRGK